MSSAFRKRRSDEGDERRERTPQHDMHPHRRFKGELHVEGATEDEEAEDEDGEHRRPVAGIDEAVVEPAAVARLRAVSSTFLNSVPSPQRGQRAITAA